MHFCRYFHDDDQIPQAIRTTLEDSLYRAFVGEHDTGTATHEVSVPGPIRDTLDRLISSVSFTHYTAANARLSERLAHEAVHWVGERWAQIASEDPFEEEQHEIETVAEGLDPTGAAQAMARRRPELAGLAEAITTAPAIARSADDRAGHRLDTEARLGLLARRWRERMENDRAHHQARLLGRSLGGFIRELEALVPRLAREQRVVRDVFGNEDALWDLSRHEWEELQLEGLLEASQMLREHPELDRLAELLGRSRSVSEQRTVHRVERRVRLRPVGVGKSEVTGVRAGDDLTSLLASEIALLAHPETQELFYAKLARRELLVLDYNRQQIVEDVIVRNVPSREEVPVDRGPAIVCVDTSGSMLGLPEKVAKATVLALARRLAVDRRRLEVIAFSSQVRSFTVDHGASNLPDLAGFLAGGFHGGTDLGKALAAALTALEQAEYRHADVLVVSDFRVPKIADRFLPRITAQHRTGTLFHSLTVARAPVVDPLHIFDSSWLFSTESGRIAPESLRAIA